MQVVIPGIFYVSPVSNTVFELFLSVNIVFGKLFLYFKNQLKVSFYFQIFVSWVDSDFKSFFCLD